MADSGLDEYLKLELSHLMDQLNSVNTARVQVASFLGTANIVILGTALSTSKAGLFAIGASTLLLGGVLDSQLWRGVVVLTIRGIALQRELSDGRRDTFLQAQQSLASKAAMAIVDGSDDDIASRFYSRRFMLGGTFTRAMLLIAIPQTLFALLALTNSFSLF